MVIIIYRCAVKDFRVSKSQKRILKRFNNFLAYGVENKNIKPSLLNKTGVVQQSFYKIYKLCENVNTWNIFAEFTHSVDVPEHFPKEHSKTNLVLNKEVKLDTGSGNLLSQLKSEDVKKVENVDKVCDIEVSKSGTFVR